MARSFLAPISSVSHPSVSDPLPPVEWEELRMLIIGSAEGVRETIHELHCRGFAEAGAWSKLLPGPNAGEVMSILTRRRSRV